MEENTAEFKTNDSVVDNKVQKIDEEFIQKRKENREKKSNYVNQKTKMEKMKPTFYEEKYIDDKWTCENNNIMQIYMKLFAEKHQSLKDNELNDDYAFNPTKLPNIKYDKKEEETLEYDKFPNEYKFLNIFNVTNQVDRTKANKKLALDVASRVNKPNSSKWPKVSQCLNDSFIQELKQCKSIKKCAEKNYFHENYVANYENYKSTPDFSWHKELGHARIPPHDHSIQNLFVDHSVGENYRLINGCYIKFKFLLNKKKNWSFSNVCLRGINQGMHLLELDSKRTRNNTWKFCFYQAIIALLAKTQMKYKFVWSANIDYIYELAWILFNYIGTINVKTQQLFEDVVVYNYKYNIEIKLLNEISIPLATNLSPTYIEKYLIKSDEIEIKELMDIKGTIGSVKINKMPVSPVHKSTKIIEDWFEKLEINNKSCIFRTVRFSLAFWHDGLFWYLYNPYRCDKFGFWEHKGYACIVKFSSKYSLKRHLIVLLLRAFADKNNDSQINNKYENENLRNNKTEASKTKETIVKIQIFQMIYHSCQIQNPKLLQRVKRKTKPKEIKGGRQSNDLNYFPPDLSACDETTNDYITAVDNEINVGNIEKCNWLQNYKITWSYNPHMSNKNKVKTMNTKLQWHQYYVEEPQLVFSLWAQIHPTNEIFVKENRGNQTFACYIVCAGMTKIIAPEYWSSDTLNCIVLCGDRYYTHSKIENETKATKCKNTKCWSQYLAKHFKIGEILFEIEIHPTTQGKLYSRSSKCLWQSLEQMFLKCHYCILICERVRLGLFKLCGTFYMCDVQSIGAPLFQYGSSVAYLIRTTNFPKFMQVLIVTIKSSKCSQFSLTPIEILQIVDVGSKNHPKK